MLEQERAYYKQHEVELLEQYKGRWILLTGDSLYGAYDTQKQAYDAGVNELGLGEFMIQEVEDEEKLIQKFYSPRVQF